VVLLENAPESVPALMVKPDSVDIPDKGPITVILYVNLVTPFCAVTVITTVLEPGLSKIGVLGAPEATVVPFTVTVAPTPATIGVTMA